MINCTDTIKLNNGEKLKNIRYCDLRPWSLENNIYHVYLNSSEDILVAKDKTSASSGILLGVHSLIKPEIFQQFPLGVFALHASLLPQLKGWSPLNWAILLGFKETGVTLFKLVKEMDAGPIVSQQKFSILESDYISDLIQKSYTAINECFGVFTEKLFLNTLTCTEQDAEKSTFCLQRREEDSRINWRESAESIIRLIKASSIPYFGAFSILNGKKVRIFRAKKGKLAVSGRPGQIFKFSKDMNFHIMCKDHCIEIEDYLVERESNTKQFLLNSINHTFDVF